MGTIILTESYEEDDGSNLKVSGSFLIGLLADVGLATLLPLKIGAAIFAVDIWIYELFYGGDDC